MNKNEGLRALYLDEARIVGKLNTIYKDGSPSIRAPRLSRLGRIRAEYRSHSDYSLDGHRSALKALKDELSFDPSRYCRSCAFNAPNLPERTQNILLGASDESVSGSDTEHGLSPGVRDAVHKALSDAFRKESEGSPPEDDPRASDNTKPLYGLIDASGTVEDADEFNPFTEEAESDRERIEALSEMGCVLRESHYPNNGALCPDYREGDGFISSSVIAEQSTINGIDSILKELDGKS